MDRVGFHSRTPPVAFYLAAFSTALLDISIYDYLRYVPAVIALLSAAAMYMLVRCRSEPSGAPDCSGGSRQGHIGLYSSSGSFRGPCCPRPGYAEYGA